MSEFELEEIKRKVDANALGNGEESQIDEEVTHKDNDEAGNGEQRNEIDENDVETEEAVIEASDEIKSIVERLRAIVAEGKRCDGIMFRKLDRKALKLHVDKVNKAMKYIKCRNTTDTNNLIIAGSVWVAENLD